MVRGDSRPPSRDDQDEGVGMQGEARRARSVGELRVQKLTVVDDADAQRRGSAPEYHVRSQRSSQHSSQDRGSRPTSYRGSGRSRPPSPYPRP